MGGGGVETACVGVVGSDPRSEEWFVFRVVSLYCHNDGTVVEFGAGCFHVNGKDCVIGVLVEQSLCEFVEFLGAARAAGGELVVANGCNYGG